MRETTVLCEVVCGAEPAEAPNGADFALRRDDELCAHDGESRIGVFDASESDGRSRHARRGRLHSRYMQSSGHLPVSSASFRPNLATGCSQKRHAAGLSAACVLRAPNWYNGEDDGSWVPLEPAEGHFSLQDLSFLEFLA